jgi:TRAP-type C4-dicarboxylate transport system substrate-binding protein
MAPRIRTRVAALGVLGALTLTACAESAGGAGSGGTGEGVEPGASKEDYLAAFENVDPIELITQSPAPKGAVTGKNVESYLDAVTEWSGGKITFDVSYANAVAPPTEVDDALLDGRLDLGQVLPLYEPSDYPANAALVEATFVSDQSAVAGTLQSNAWPNEVAFRTPEILAEYEDQGIKLMVPQYNSGVNVLFCREPKRDLAATNGMQAASGGQAQSAEITALGGSPVSVAYPELFESLQRGVVDCTVSSLTVGVLGGFVETAPHITIDPSAGFAMAPGGMAISQTAWDALPLVAQQLMWDRLDVFLSSNIVDKIWPNTVDAVKQAKAADGSIGAFEPDAQRAINDANDSMLRELSERDAVGDSAAFVDNVEGAARRWLAAVDELGITGDVPYDEFDTWYTADKVDVDAYVKKVYEDVFLEYRPS